MKKVYAWIGIYGFEFDPQEITDKLGITPSEAWKKGDKKPFRDKFINIHKNTWKLISDLGDDKSPEEHIAHLLSQVKIAEEKFKEFSRKHYSELGLAIYVEDKNYGVHFDKNIMDALSNLKLELDLDIYHI